MTDEPTPPMGLPSGEPQPEPEPVAEEDPRAARRLLRSRDDRLIAGVCGGAARYFGIDPVIARIVAVALVFLSGVGIVAYLAAWVLVPEEPAQEGADPPPPRRPRLVVVAAAVLAACAALVIADNLFWWPDVVFGPLTLLALAAAAVWWLVRGRRGASAGSAAARVALVAAVVVASVAALALGFWATGLGGGLAMAGLLVLAGLGITAAAFMGGARWMILPALALALGVGVATGADVDLRGDYGERIEVPRTLADLPAAYDMGAGRLQVDLRSIDFPTGERRLRVDLGVGEVVLAVPENVCVVTDARVGVGEMRVLGRNQEGIELERQDGAVAEGPRLVLDAHIGIGSLQVVTDPADADWNGFDPGPRGTPSRASAACLVGTRG